MIEYEPVLSRQPHLLLHEPLAASQVIYCMEDPDGALHLLGGADDGGL